MELQSPAHEGKLPALATVSKSASTRVAHEYLLDAVAILPETSPHKTIVLHRHFNVETKSEWLKHTSVASQHLSFSSRQRR